MRCAKKGAQTTKLLNGSLRQLVLRENRLNYYVSIVSLSTNRGGGDEHAQDAGIIHLLRVGANTITPSCSRKATITKKKFKHARFALAHSTALETFCIVELREHVSPPSLDYRTRRAD